MEVILFLCVSVLFFKYIARAIYLFANFGITILISLILKFSLDISFIMSLLLVVGIKYMLKDLSKKIHLSVNKCNKQRIETDSAGLRKLVRVLFECNYILFVFNCYLHILALMRYTSIFEILTSSIEIYLFIAFVSFIKLCVDFFINVVSKNYTLSSEN